MDVKLLEQLVKLMADNGLSTVELTDGDRRITLKRGGETTATPQMFSYGPPAGSSAPQSAPAPISAPPADDDSKLIPVKSPMPGTFYAAPAKGAKPFITVGAKVEEDTDVCIIEAMKVFNTIKAEARGIIAKILVQDGQPVEFGQVLFLVKRD
ncbi:MAG TPA: acetyl-CoA carboxylase biotin carboxyl carrier protein [Tepidisphaeraceae bacterium]|jgi:acetyl-CoA carboxylase biotin carboxyl carrier protein|nr:acetyl-CoA carboxylase biotin carboxyl carrier protein [Tepidisphaeraceae bacterium]